MEHRLKKICSGARHSFMPDNKTVGHMVMKKTFKALSFDEMSFNDNMHVLHGTKHCDV